MQGAENFIRWSGDPYDADINVQAIYEAENIQMSVLDETKNGQQNNANAVYGSKAKSYLGPIWVVATLRDKLMHPTISFEIQIPPKSELRNDLYAQGEIDLINSNPGELNKQVAFLLVFNSFGPISSTGATLSANEAVGGIFVSSISSYISGAMSSYFSSKFQQVFKDKSLRVNFNTAVYNGSALTPVNPNDPNSTTYTYDRTNLNLSVIKSFMNERLTFTVGSAFDFGLTAQQASYAAVQFLPNLTAEYKLTENGRVVLTFFYRDSYNYLNIGNHTMNSSGTSISYRRDFDKLDEIFKKKKKTEVPADNTSTKN